MKHKPYTLEELRSEALKYNKKIDFLKGSRKQYKIATSRGILNEICSHMEPTRISWTKETILQESLKYTTRNQFKQNSKKAYDAANCRNILDEVCKHMKSRGYTLEEVQNEALKYTSRSQFQYGDAAIYAYARKHNLLDQVCGHMIALKANWTDEEILEEAKKYNSRSEFKKNNDSAYRVAIRRGILDQVCGHMTGGIVYWTDEMLTNEALKYTTRSEFQYKSKNAWQIARKRGLLDKICQHMSKPQNASFSETDLFKIIKQKYPKVQKLRDRKVKIKNKPQISGFDLDIYIPELRKGIEFDGDYWHSVEGLKRSRGHWPNEDLINYHKLKDQHFKSKGIDVLHIQENDWLNDKQNCINKCLDFLG